MAIIWTCEGCHETKELIISSYFGNYCKDCAILLLDSVTKFGEAARNSGKDLEDIVFPN